VVKTGEKVVYPFFNVDLRLNVDFDVSQNDDQENREGEKKSESLDKFENSSIEFDIDR
jgi:hypothetical protein